jgi:DNA-binding MarR family transcriptional regulator
MDQDFLQQFRECIRVLEREIILQNTLSCCEGVSLSQCHALLEIGNSPEISVSELAKNMQLDKSTVSRTVDGLVKKTLIDRVIPEKNRRKAMLNLTDEGKEVCKTINFTNDSYIEDILSDFSAQEREQLLGFLRKMTHNMQRISS